MQGGGSSQFKYYPHLLALSNPKKSLGCYAQPNKRREQIVLIAPQQVKTKPCASPTPVLIIKL
jgi:hypothetical protein